MDADAVRALTASLQGVRVSSRKPELPQFDSKNIDLWLKRVDNAFRRAGVTEPKDKFAFIEPKFSVDADPRVNELLFGDGTAEEWAELESYLRGRYGRTKAQQAAIILDGVQRDGRLPSEMFAFIKERIGSITVDDIVKEMVLRELPSEIRRTIHDKVKDLNGTEAVKAADQYFDRNGKQIHKPQNPSVSAVENQPPRGSPNLEEQESDEEVNAINRRFQRNRPPAPRRDKPYVPPPRRSQPQTTGYRGQRPTMSRAPAPRLEKRTHTGKPTVQEAKLCKWHTSFGKEAWTCESGCDKYPEFKAGNAKAGRQT